MTTKKSTTKQVEHGMTGKANNPEGRGGFADNPHHRSDGRWSKEGSISYNYNKIIRMTPEEIAEFVPTTMAEKIALTRVSQAAKDLGLADAKELADRTEGKSPQFIGLGGDSEYAQALVRFVGEDDEDED